VVRLENSYLRIFFQLSQLKGKKLPFFLFPVQRFVHACTLTSSERSGLLYNSSSRTVCSGLPYCCGLILSFHILTIILYTFFVFLFFSLSRKKRKVQLQSLAYQSTLITRVRGTYYMRAPLFLLLLPIFFHHFCIACDPLHATAAAVQARTHGRHISTSRNSTAKINVSSGKCHLPK
jgi:hypothetical protein